MMKPETKENPNAAGQKTNNNGVMGVELYVSPEINQLLKLLVIVVVVFVLIVDVTTITTILTTILLLLIYKVRAILAFPAIVDNRRAVSISQATSNLYRLVRRGKSTVRILDGRAIGAGDNGIAMFR